MNAMVHTLDKRRIVRGVKLALLGLLIVAGAGALLLAARGLRGHASVTNDGPLDIRLVAVCPDTGEDFYDPDGRKLDLAPDLLGAWDSGPWKSDEQHRDFLLHVGDFNGPLLPLPFTWVRAAGTDRILGGGSIPFGPDPEASTFLVSATFGRTYRRSWLRLLTLTSPVDKIDLTFRYYYGARQEALCTFTGPFQIGTAVPADEGRPYRLTPEPVEAWQESQVKFHFVTAQPFHSGTPILFYDKQGQRHYVRSGGSGGSGSSGADLTYETEAVSWDQIAAVAIGEKPHEITFRNVVVQYPHRPPRTYAAYLDVLARRLGLTALTPEQLRQYHFKDLQQAIEVLDIVRGGWHIRTAFETLAYARPPLKISELDPAAQEKIHQVAARWAGARETSFYGIQLGLLGHWPEFFDLALEQLSRDGPTEDRVPYYESYKRAWLNANREIAGALTRYWSGLNQSEARKLQHAILTLGDGPVLTSLLRCLWSGAPEAVLEPLWELAQDDRPWIWWKALEAWSSRMALARRSYGDLPEKIRLRRILVEGSPDDETLQARATAQLAQMLTPELGQMSSPVWNTVRERIARRFDRKAATRIYLDYLRQMQSAVTARQWAADDAWKGNAKWMVAGVIRTLNVWYGLDLGHLGAEETANSHETLPRNFSEFQHLLAEVLQWRENNPEEEPLEQSLCGKVVDTAGRGITTAELKLIRYEDYTGADGHRYQRQVEAGRCRPDAAGDFAFRNLPNGSYALHLAAEGYAAPELLHVSQLPDGRFRIFGATQDNVLVLAKQASLSGTVIGSDGRPLANAVLNVSSYPVHGVPSHGSCSVDERGHFAVVPVTAGYYQLRYDERDRRSAAGEYGGRTAFRLVQVQEAQTIDNVVLDLRESTAGLEFEIVDGQGRPLGAESVSVEVEIPSRNPPSTWVTFLRAVSPQSVHRLPHLPPLEGYLSVRPLGLPPQQIPIKLVAGQTTRYRIGPESTGARRRVPRGVAAPTPEQQTSVRPNQEGSSGGPSDR